MLFVFVSSLNYCKPDRLLCVRRMWVNHFNLPGNLSLQIWKQEQEFIYLRNFNQIAIRLSMGVSISLDVVSMETLDLDTKIKSVSTVEKILTSKKVSLDDRDILIEIEISRFCLCTTFQYQKSRPRHLSRHDIFGKSWQFVSISIES